MTSYDTEKVVSRPLAGLLALVLTGFHSLSADAANMYPHSDPANLGNWMLRTDMSDEFEGPQLDEEKWLVQGREDVYRSNFIGRDYWQFSPDNVRVENGMLKITTRHEPDYPWNPDSRFGIDYCEYTTAGVSTKARFTYGYMEIKCKAAHAETTSSFWTTGMPESQLELDVFEAIGKHPSRTRLMWSTIHDWELSNPNYVWTQTITLPFAVGDGFHIYGAECDPDYVKFYADGLLVGTATREWVEQYGIHSTRWPMDGGQYVWVDSEIFEWWGMPDPADLPADYEVEYVRIWDKGPPTPWQHYASLYGLSGIKSAHSDTDNLSDWQEYIFDGNPTNPADIGVKPEYDSATGDYIFQLRNDTNLAAFVATKTDLADPDWYTNETVTLSAHDGAMGTHVSTLATSPQSLYIKLLIRDLNLPPYQVLIGNGGATGTPSSGNGNFEGSTGSGGAYPFSLIPHWFNLSGSELGNCGTTSGMEGSPEPYSHGCFLSPLFNMANDTGYTVQTIDETFDIGIAVYAYGNTSSYTGDEQLVLYLFTSNAGVDEDTEWADINILSTTVFTIEGDWTSFSAKKVYSTQPADIGKTIHLGLTLENPTDPTVYPRVDIVTLEVNSD